MCLKLKKCPGGFSRGFTVDLTVRRLGFFASCDRGELRRPPSITSKTAYYTAIKITQKNVIIISNI